MRQRFALAFTAAAALLLFVAAVAFAVARGRMF